MDSNPAVQVIWIAVAPKTAADRDKLGRGLSQLIAEDLTIRLLHDSAAETAIAGVSELHLEIILSRGRASYSMRFDHYQPIPEELDLDDRDRGSLVGAPRRPIVPARDSAIALPEPEEDDPDDEWFMPRG